MVLRSFTLGSRPPMVTGVKLYRNASPGVAEGAFMDIDMLWSGLQVRHFDLQQREHDVGSLELNKGPHQSPVCKERCLFEHWRTYLVCKGTFVTRLEHFICKPLHKISSRSMVEMHEGYQPRCQATAAFSEAGPWHWGVHQHTGQALLLAVLLHHV